MKADTTGARLPDDLNQALELGKKVRFTIDAKTGVVKDGRILTPEEAERSDQQFSETYSFEGRTMKLKRPASAARPPEEK